MFFGASFLRTLHDSSKHEQNEITKSGGAARHFESALVTRSSVLFDNLYQTMARRYLIVAVTARTHQCCGTTAVVADWRSLDQAPAPPTAARGRLCSTDPAATLPAAHLTPSRGADPWAMAAGSLPRPSRALNLSLSGCRNAVARRHSFTDPPPCLTPGRAAGLRPSESAVEPLPVRVGHCPVEALLCRGQASALPRRLGWPDSLNPLSVGCPQPVVHRVARCPSWPGHQRVRVEP